MKYSLKFKLKMINLKKEGKLLEYPTDCSKSAFMHKVRLWERIYDLHGEPLKATNDSMDKEEFDT